MARRLPPQDIEAQDAVIGACLLSAHALDKARRVVTQADFVGPVYQACWETMGLLRDAHETVDVITVAAGLEAVLDKPIEWLHSRQNATPAISGVVSYANRVLACAQSRSLIHIGAELTDAGYDMQSAVDVAHRIGNTLLDDERLRRHAQDVRGFYDDIAALDPGSDRDEAQPWIAEGFLRRGQRLLVVAKAGLGKSTLLRQIAFCAAAGVHPLIGQPVLRQRKALIVELEAAEWDIVDSMRGILHGIQRALATRSVFDAPRPALLHRPGGLDLRDTSGRAALEAAIQQVRPEIVCIGPVKYMSMMRTGENYENAALHLHAVLNDLVARYGVALCLEAHFSRGDHGAPGGSERWVDWPDIGFSMHPANDDIANRMAPGGAGDEITVKQFRIPRDQRIWLPHQMVRGAKHRLPWSVDDRLDPHRTGVSIFASRYGGVASSDFRTHEQMEF